MDVDKSWLQLTTADYNSLKVTPELMRRGGKGGKLDVVASIMTSVGTLAEVAATEPPKKVYVLKLIMKILKLLVLLLTCRWASSL